MIKTFEFKAEGYDRVSHSWLPIPGFPKYLPDEISAQERINRCQHNLESDRYSEFRIMRRTVKYEKLHWNIVQNNGGNKLCAE